MVTLPRRVFTPCKAAKESSVKRRQFIDGMNYHFNIQFKKYKAEHHRAEREDSWTRGIISKVHCECFVLPVTTRIERLTVTCLVHPGKYQLLSVIRR